MVVKENLIWMSIVALAGAMLPLPYAYYMLLRVGMCGVLGFLAYTAWTSKKEGLAWALGFTAAVYNPFAPLHLGREVWTIVNLATMGLLFYVRSQRSEDECDGD